MCPKKVCSILRLHLDLGVFEGKESGKEIELLVHTHLSVTKQKDETFFFFFFFFLRKYINFLLIFLIQQIIGEKNSSDFIFFSISFSLLIYVAFVCIHAQL